MDNELSNLEGGIPVLCQFLEFPSIETSSSNAQVDDSNAQVDEIEDGQLMILLMEWIN